MSIVELPELSDDTITAHGGPRRARVGSVSPAHARHTTLLMDDFDDEFDDDEFDDEFEDDRADDTFDDGPVMADPATVVDLATESAPAAELEPAPAVFSVVPDLDTEFQVADDADPAPAVVAEVVVEVEVEAEIESAPVAVLAAVEAIEPVQQPEAEVEPAALVTEQPIPAAPEVEPAAPAPLALVVEPDTEASGPVWEGAAKYANGATDPIDDIWAAPATDHTDDVDDAAMDELELLQAAATVQREPSTPLDDPNAELSRIIEEDLVTMVYQPITSLLDNSVVGYEALARGPEDSQLATPAAMFSTAENNGRLNELDMHCQTAAVLQARDVLLKSGHALFINAEPSLLADAAFGRDPEAAERLTGLLKNMTSSCPVVLEISDRHPYASAAELLGIVMWARGNGFRIALDDISVNPQSLSLLPLLEPDVIKLDRWVLNADHDADLGLLLNALRMQAERTGAAIVAQGIETPEDRERALAFGATHIQGFGVGLPAELSEAPLRIRSLEPVRASYAESAVSPFDLVSSTMSRRTGNAGVLSALTLDLENQARLHRDAILLSNFESGIAAPATIEARYHALAEELDFVVLLNEEFSSAEGLYTGHAESNDPMCIERSIVVLTPHFSAALLARRSGAPGAGDEFTFTVTYDRGLVTRAARMLLAHVDA